MRTKYEIKGHSIYCGTTEIARSYVGSAWNDDKPYHVRILQGMPRMETQAKIIELFSEWAAENCMDNNTVPKLFSGH